MNQSTTHSGRFLTKAEVLCCVNEHSGLEFGPPLTVQVFDELIRHSVIVEGRRVANRGLQPTFVYPEEIYDQVLALRQWRARGVCKFDALAVASYLDGYDFSPPRLGDALWKEYARGARVLNRKLRSGYLANHRRVGEAHKASILRNAGPLDPALIGMAFDPDFLIELLRAAQHGQIEDLTTALEEFVQRGLTDDSGRKLALAMVSGMLAVPSPTDTDRYDLRDLIHRSLPDDLNGSRQLYNFIFKMLSNFGVIRIPSFEKSYTDNVIHIRWSVLIIVVLLRVNYIEYSRIWFACEQASARGNFNCDAVADVFKKFLDGAM